MSDHGATTRGSPGGAYPAPPTPAVRVRIPGPLRRFAEGAEEVTLPAPAVRTAGEVLDAVVARYPALRRHLLDEAGLLRDYVNVFRNRDDVRFGGGLETPVEAGDTLTIVPSIAGG